MGNIFDFDWFKSEHRKEKEKLELANERLKNDVLLNELIITEKVKEATSLKIEDKPFLNIKLVNNTLTIVLKDGNIISKPNATQEDFKKARQAKYEEELFVIASCSEGILQKKEEVKQFEAAKKLIEGFDTLKGLEDFEVDGSTVYLKGIKRSLPPLLVEKFAQLVKNIFVIEDGYSLQDTLNDNQEYQGLKRFFMWCALNPRAEVADKLYNFLVKNSFKITKQGFFVALRNVVTVGTDDKTLVKFISEVYNKVKAVWKKKPSDYVIYRDGETREYYFTKITDIPRDMNDGNEVIGNLEKLYMDLPNMVENRYTDAHTRTFDIRIGQPVSMPMELCKWNTDDCGAEGLHFTANEIHYVGCGDTSVLVLINPMKVVGIGESKGRCYEYLPIMTVPTVEATKLLSDLDFDTLELDEDFAVRELENLAEKAKNGFTAEAKKYEFNLPSISSVEINKIVASLDEMKNSISKRVVNVV